MNFLKRAILRQLPKVINSLEIIEFKLTDNKIKDDKYSSLAPIAINGEDDSYYKALKWAFENRINKDIKNIAVTGPYGSGKSTVLKTFQTKYKGGDAKYLNISLASFGNELKDKIEGDEENDTNEKSKDTLLRKIETSILQQIFFYEDDDKIPDSRFKKIRNRNWFWQFKMAMLTILFSLSIVNLLFPNFIQGIFKIEFQSTTSDILHYISYILVFSIGFAIIYKSSRLIRTITIEKFKIKNVKFTVGDRENKSILNHHLDEIIYFFSVRPYNVVIIEDLDRFQQTEIFIKLREINNLLNNSKKLNGKHVLFIYAVRDDMFKDVERTKFFDFVIPVIPIINSFNSGEKIREWVENQKFELSEDFIDNISYYIDDMRLLINICNEFSIYSGLQNSSLSREKLFSIITYKNKYPKDFVLLNQNEGVLFDILKSKKSLVTSLTKSIVEKIKKNKNDIDRINSREDLSIGNLRKLYVLQAIEGLAQFKCFHNNGEVTINDVIQDENWELFESGKIGYVKYLPKTQYRLSHEVKQTGIDMKTLQNRVDSEATYRDKYKDIRTRTNGELKQLKNDLFELRKRKDTIARLPISKLLMEFPKIQIPRQKTLDQSFLELVVTNDYISEDYSFYTSLFHGKSLTRVDHKFIIDVKNRNKPDFDIKLTRIENIVPKLSEYLFESNSVLNHSLLDFLLLNENKYSKSLERFFANLSDGSNDSLLFIKEHRKISSSLHTFVLRLCSANFKLWAQVRESTYFSDEEKNELIINILDFGAIDNIKEIDKYASFKTHIEDNPHFLNMCVNSEHSLAAIKMLDIRFKVFDFENTDESISIFVYEGNHYKISYENIKNVINRFDGLAETKLNSENYSSIINSNAEYLKEYIQSNIVEYINNVYLNLNDSTNDDVEHFTQLINYISVKEALEHKLLKKWEGKLNSINSNGMSTTPTYLLDENKVMPTWKNLFQAFDENLDQDVLTNFLNDDANVKELSQKYVTETGIENNNDFIETLFNLDGLNEETIRLLVSSLKLYDYTPKLESLSVRWITALISENLISPSIENFDLLSNRGDNTQVRFYLQNHDAMNKFQDQLYFDVKGLHALLLSDKIASYTKAYHIKLFSNHDQLLISNKECEAVGNLMLEVSPVYTSRELAFKIIEFSSVKNSLKINLFSHFVRNNDQYDIDTFLKGLGAPYSSLVYANRMAKLVISDINKSLLDKLKGLNYISSFSEKHPILKDSFYRVNFKRK